jgi:iron complex transport system ATP-binding protein
MLALDDVTFTRGGRALVNAVSLALRPGELAGLLGPNGAGKSTLLGLLSGRLAPTRGRVTLDGTDLGAWASTTLARRRAMLVQEPSLAFAFTGLEVTLLGRHPHCGGHPGAQDRQIAMQALHAADAAPFAHRPVDSLSGGERARVHLARVLAQVAWEPADTARVLLLDEPTASLDLAHQHALLARLKRLARETGLAVLASVHDLNLAARHTDRLLMLSEGELIADGAPDAVLTPETVQRCFGVATARIPVPGQTHPTLVVIEALQ